MNKFTKLLTFVLVIFMAACSSEEKFTVKGKISGADDKTLYLDAAKLQGTITLDSIKLNSKGVYQFEANRPESPEYYRIRLDNKVINFSIDSTETVTINADFDHFETGYDVENSENSLRIKEITLKQMELQKKADELYLSARQGKISVRSLQESVSKLFDAYKEDIKRNYIYEAPNMASAYYALFLKVGGYMLFDPFNNREDLKCYAAVATSLSINYPHADRAKLLYDQTRKAQIKNREPKVETLEIPEEKIGVAGIIDIELRDAAGKMRKLSELDEKVVLLDFTIFQSPVSAAHIFGLRELYDKYAAKGFGIYQISLDADEHYWKTTSDSLPWVCVRDGLGIYSNYAKTYLVQDIPSYFIIKENEIVARGEQIKDLDQFLKSLL